MIITRTPFRISFFGGGTDYPAWYNEHGGSVLSTTIDKYCYITCRYLPPFFEHRHRIVYSRIETVQKVEEIIHPAVRAILAMNGNNQQEGLEIHHDGDLPARSGLGSSSSFTVGLLHALAALKGKFVSKLDLANAAIHVERNVIKEEVGSQDQVATAYGGFNKIQFYPDNSFDVSPVIVSSERLKDLQNHCMLFFTGLSRYSSEIAKSTVSNIAVRRTELTRMREMVDEALQILQDKDTSLEEFGKLLHESWLRKRSLSDKISTPQIDSLYEQAMKAGALGGKILGAGGGGFLLIFTPPTKQPLVLKSLKNLIHVPFQFEQSGSRVVLFQPDGLR